MADIPDSGVTFSSTTTASAPTNFGLPVSQRQNVSVDRFQSLRDTILKNIRVSIPAIVQSFDRVAGTITAIIAINDSQQMNVNGDGVARTSSSVPGGPIDVRVVSVVPGVILTDIPIQMAGGGGWTLTFPIKPGDECILIFQDADIDSWFQSGGLANEPITPRRHNLSDAIAVFGVRSSPRVLSNYSGTSTQLRNDARTVVIDLAATEIKITAPSVVIDTGDSGEVTINGNNVSVNANDTIDLEANTVKINAANVVTIDGAGSVSIEGKNFLLHTHSGVTTGSGISGPVN